MGIDEEKDIESTVARKCPRCGAINTGKRFCGDCGARLPLDSAKIGDSKSRKSDATANILKKIKIILPIVLIISLFCCPYDFGRHISFIGAVLAIICIYFSNKGRFKFILAFIFCLLTMLISCVDIIQTEGTDSTNALLEVDYSMNALEYERNTIKQIEKIEKDIQKKKYDKASERLLEIELNATDRLRLSLDILIGQNKYNDAANAIIKYCNDSGIDFAILADDPQVRRLDEIVDLLDETVLPIANDYIKKLDVAKLENVSGHTWIAATCTEPDVCSLCGEKRGTSLGHEWIEATCTEAKICMVCNEKEGEPLGHTVEKWKTITKATCSEEGEEEGKCSVCGESVMQSIPKIEHVKKDWEITDVNVAAGTATKVMKCSICDAVIETKAYVLSADEKMDYYKDSCESVSYDDLIRYPDKYNGKPIKVKVTILDVETVDSVIFEDLYSAKLNGSTVSIFDGRDVKEPKLRKGDTVTIYGVGDGYNTEYTYRSGLILGLPRDIETTKIPSIKIKYVKF